jgi:N-methylhydantoinase B
MLVSETLEVTFEAAEAEYRCRRCQGSLGPAGHNYKLTALIEEVPVMSANPLIGDPGRFVDEEVVYRLFYCPGCGGLLDTEVARTADPPLWDIQPRIKARSGD